MEQTEKEQLKHWIKKAKEFEQVGSFVMGVVVVSLITISTGFLFYQVRTLGPGKMTLPSFGTPAPTTILQQPATEVKQQRIHTVKKSEGLWQIAQQYYNDGNQYLKIYEANKDKMKNPEDINEGMQLIIPE